MTGSTSAIHLYGFNRHTVAQLTVAALCGACTGAIIGAAISLSLGLFYSSASLLIVAVITVTAMLGAVFGHVMASLLVEDNAYAVARAAHGPQMPENTAKVVDLSDHKALRAEKELRQPTLVSASEEPHSAQVLQYRPDVRLFEIIVSAAQKG